MDKFKCSSAMSAMRPAGQEKIGSNSNSVDIEKANRKDFILEHPR